MNFPVVGIVIGAVQMYFHFQMMTDFAALAQTYQGADQTLDRRLLRWRTLQTLLLTATTILFYLQERLPEVWAAVMVVLAVVYIVAGISLMAALFALRRCFRDPPARNRIPLPGHNGIVPLRRNRFFYIASPFCTFIRLRSTVMNTR